MRAYKPYGLRGKIKAIFPLRWKNIICAYNIFHKQRTPYPPFKIDDARIPD
jgi:hypothetical protein